MASGEPISAAGPVKSPDVDFVCNVIFFDGIWALVYGVLGSLGFCISGALLWFPACCIPGSIFSIVVGVLALLQGLKLRGPEAHLQPPPKTLAILMIVNFISGDVITGVLGILTLMKLQKPDVSAYFKGGSAAVPPAGP